MNVVEETVGVIRRAPHSEGEYEGNKEDAHRVVPIKKLEAIILNALISVGPRTPADSARDHHDQRNVQTMRSKHYFSLTMKRVKNYLRILETKDNVEASQL